MDLLVLVVLELVVAAAVATVAIIMLWRLSCCGDYHTEAILMLWVPGRYTAGS
jgi:hypothetical protein